MKNVKYFDHRIGDENSVMDDKELKMLKRIIKSHAEEYSDEERMNFQRVGVHLKMKDYLANPIKEIIPIGEFLNELLSIYKLKKIKFAELIEYENTNLHAVLKGRRKLNNKLATKIGLIFSIEPELWMFIEAKNELAKYKKENKGLSRKYSIKKLKYAR